MRTTQKIKYMGLRARFCAKSMTLDFNDTVDRDYDDETDEDDDATLIFPCRYEVCGDCNGRGTTTRHIEADGGGFTSSEWAEACDGDPDFAEDYMSGAYDRPCPECNGRNVVPVITEDANPEGMKKILEWARDEADYRACVAAERRMGA